MLRSLSILSTVCICTALSGSKGVAELSHLLSGSPAGRRAVLSAASAAAALPLHAAIAFDLPILEDFDDPKARAAAAKKPNPPLEKQQWAAFYAVTTNDQSTLNEMKQNNWSLAALKDSSGKTVLHRAAQVGNAAAVTLLLSDGSNVNAVNQWKETPLHMATRNGKLDCVKQLVAAGADVTKVTLGGDTALVLAKKYRMTSVEEYLSSL